MNCKICGAPLAPGEVFCKNCGASNVNDDTNSTIPIVETDVNDEKISNSEAKSEKSNSEIAGNGNFLVVIGIIVGILAAAVIGYLIYSSLQESHNENDNPGVTLVNQQKYTIRYEGYSFQFDSNSTVSIGEFLNISLVEGSARIYVDSTSEASNYNIDNINRAFENSYDYKIFDVAEKSYNGQSCFEASADYNSGNKTKLLMCNIDNKYWVAEIGTFDYSKYPSDEVISKFANIIFSGKKVEEESQLKIGRFEVKAEEIENTENE